MIDKEVLEKLNCEKFLSYILIIPIVEEIIFRAPLLIPRAKIFSLLISIGFILSFIIYVQNEKIQLSLISAVGLFEIAYWKSNKLKQFINDFIERKYLFLVIVSSFSFGLLHLGNYESIDFISFISVIGRIIGGFYLAFIVTKYGLKSSCLMHGINNIIPFIILLGFEK